MLWIKICGLTTPDAVEAAVSGGADAIGFVFAPSKRQVSVAQAAALAHHAIGKVVRVAVMQHPSQALVDEVCEVFRPDALQTDAEDFAHLKLPVHVQAIPVVRDRDVFAQLPARVLYEGRISGSGSTADWAQARMLATSTQLILAGGLNEANVTDAIAVVRPFGVDVSSGVESAPGVKDPSSIRRFIRAARSR
jgi:phosphoribosylanthranilate isomerase